MRSRMNAPLIERTMERCMRIEIDRVPDGLGGFLTVQQGEAPFFAAIVREKAQREQIAQRPAERVTYAVAVPPGTGLKFGDLFRRARDGAVFRVVSGSEDSAPPPCASFAFERARAERGEWT